LFLLSTTQLDVSVAVVVGIAGAVFVEITHRTVAAGLHVDT
jgi:hypothetical protein